nr:hypothetical protein [Tanacetum cinerariifolium]
MQEKLKLSKSRGASTPAEMKHMQNVPYVSTVDSIMYAKLSILLLSMLLKKLYGLGNLFLDWEWFPQLKNP